MVRFNEFKGKRIFISGGAGVIGNALTQKLCQVGAIVMVGDLKPRPLNWSEEIIYRQGDLNYISAAEIARFEPEIFFHLAATFERSVETYDFWYENYHHNVQLSHHLLSCVKDLPSIKQVVFASSYLIYDSNLYCFDTPKNTPVTLYENAPINTRNLCGAAKLYHESEMEFVAQFNLDTKFVSARIYRSYGKGSRDIVSRWIRSALSDETLYLFGEDAFFDYIYAEEVAEGLMALAVSNTSGIFNLGTGKSQQVKDIIDCLVEHFPGLSIEKGSSNIMYEASQAGIGKLLEVTGFSPRYNLEQAIPEIISYEKERAKVEQKTGNVLVTSVSRKVPLIREVRNAIRKFGKKIKIYGGDANAEALARFFVDEFWCMPLIKRASAASVIEYCHNQDITAVIPSRDGELTFFAEHKLEFERAGINVMISPVDSIKNCLDKLHFYEVVNELGYPAIPTYSEIRDIKSDYLVVKERYGAGSQSIGLQLTPEAARLHAEQLEDPIYQPYINGCEYSIDVYLDRFEKAKGAVVRERVYVVNGESQVTTTVLLPDLEEICCQLAQKMHLYGHIIFQVIVDSQGNYHIIECNPRFGGASSLSVAAGLDSFYWFLLECAGEKLDIYPFIRGVERLTQVRYPDDLIIRS